MLGTEYSWLLTPTDPAEETSRVRLASTGLLTLAVGGFCLVCIFLLAGAPARAASSHAPGPVAVVSPVPSAP